MEFFIISFTALLASLLTFFSGFGLGTLLTPVFILFFSAEVAIVLTGIVHFLNNIFKFGLTYRNIDKNILLRFGLASVPSALLGAWLLFYAVKLPDMFSYSINKKEFTVVPVKLIIASLILIFALMESVPSFKNMKANKNRLIAGGLISGFFGGLSGHQGALRTVFLAKEDLNKESFIATGICIACFVDLTRLPVYFINISRTNFSENIPILSCAVVSAFAGAYFGNRLLKKTTLGAVQKIVTAALVLLALALGSGIV